MFPSANWPAARWWQPCTLCSAWRCSRSLTVPCRCVWPRLSACCPCLGCFLANLLGSTIVDVILGTLATLLACVVTYKLRNVRIGGLAIPASLPPVAFNAVIIGIEIAVLFPEPGSSAPLWLACVSNGISVGIGELISCTVLGVLLVKIIESNTALKKIFE